MVKILFSSILFIIFIYFIIIYFFLKNIDEEKIINNIQNSQNIIISKNKDTIINIFPSINIITDYDLLNLEKNISIKNLNTKYFQSLLFPYGKLNIYTNYLKISKLIFSDVNVDGTINLFKNFLLNNFDLDSIFDGVYNIKGNLALKTSNEEKLIISLLELFFEKLENDNNYKFAFSELINTFGNDSSSFTGLIVKNNNLLKSDNIVLLNSKNKVFIKGEYNYENNTININLDLSQNDEIYLTTFIVGNINKPNIEFDKNSKFFRNLNSNDNNIIEQSIIKLIDNFLDLDD